MTGKHIQKLVRSTARLVGFDKPNVFAEFTGLAITHKAVNLGQGFPDWESPTFCKDAMIRAVHSNFNQYCRSAGEINLVNAVSTHYSPLLNNSIDPLTEVAISVGSTECFFAIMQAYIEEDDEVVMLEPAFDIYPAQAQMAGGKSVLVPLLPPKSITGQWSLDFNQLEAAINPKTKLLILNTPHNPTGRVFSRDELLQLSRILLRHPHVICVCDEVYENIVFTAEGHTRLASLPDMWGRVITVSSAGKTFSVTGWKIGWAIGAKELIAPVILANQWIQFSVSTPAQRAVADMLTEAALPYQGHASYYAYLHVMYMHKMDMLVQSLKNAGLTCLKTEGSFFLVCDISNVSLPEQYAKQCLSVAEGGDGISRDWAFCRWLTKEIGVAAIPCSVFYTAERKHLASHLVRFCFCKMDESLIEAGNKLLRLKPFVNQ